MTELVPVAGLAAEIAQYGPPLVALVTAGSILLLAAFVVVLVVGYMLGCRIWPYANCPACSGSGKSGSPTRKSFRNCPRCSGSGRRRRFGRILLDRNAARKH